ncbi:Translation initiation factor 1 [Monocercomonoides exilis]|uniref:Translation initiation factor 1 n=1 Tax=Monocercomonoides exilis TaxID=2049356 RepID=UPI0035599A96|nr:Translation initiation factor 1 [Monocercomonoides exilis]|eukprot:MONOS_6067.1-p1 / transcript=MONOS_6067.1 / gene=MONOS_6067 / organism=Monocercomonoides_exilis_PA203 / gene_product=Translation initiation factor 1 / transcript_product=Translation initiation factor 1 / location=Mono_scaffold00186:33487-34072(-) / protein_length=108 / sequence_SO=supercontig / SO=protein_coding / is_pseudo=false
MSRSSKLDPFASDLEETAVGPDGLVHIRVQNRKGKKKVTTITGLGDIVDFKAVLHRLIKLYKCGGAIVKDDEFGKVIRIHGDFRDQIRTFLIENKMATDTQIKTHLS